MFLLLIAKALEYFLQASVVDSQIKNLDISLVAIVSIYVDTGYTCSLSTDHFLIHRANISILLYVEATGNIR
jgi:hypothetical protein